MINRIAILLGVLILLCQNAKSQFAFMGGPNISYIRNHDLLKDQSPLIGYNAGVSLRIYPLKKDSPFSIQSELLFNQKGYMQKLDQNYRFNFNYISWTLLANYPIVKNFSVNTGLELSGLLSSNIKEWTNTYNHTDLGLVLGISCFDSRRINFYARATYGLLPMLDYYKIDQLGNFTGNIHDLRNMCISAGIKINLHNEKLRLFK